MTAPSIVRPVPDGDTGKYALLMVWDDTNGQWVPSTTGTGAVSTQVQGNVASGVTDSGNPVKVGGKYSSTRPVIADGQRADMQMDTKGNLGVKLFLSPTTGSDGFANSAVVWVRDEGNTQNSLPMFGEMLFNGTSWDRLTKANLVSRLLSAAASTNSTLVKNAAGTVHKIRGYNAKASFVYLKLYNKATAPTVGTDTPVASFTLPASAAFEIDLGPYGLYFATGIGFGLTGAIADADTTALVAADITGLNVLYS